jgi:hypothetical protein
VEINGDTALSVPENSAKTTKFKLSLSLLSDENAIRFFYLEPYLSEKLYEPLFRRKKLKGSLINKNMTRYYFRSYSYIFT